ncbi:hypothetical protein CHELA40_12383 [Chelatococcus asaccharovorans]|nr:hypothetical protein CHELA40_12383 [Chelatococcus asaccharovorans]CAH1682827.1 hypothetical protein CHELA17_63224 [Chelatococcus asaccharovorans]
MNLTFVLQPDVRRYSHVKFASLEQIRLRWNRLIPSKPVNLLVNLERRQVRDRRTCSRIVRTSRASMMDVGPAVASTPRRCQRFNDSDGR